MSSTARLFISFLFVAQATGQVTDLRIEPQQVDAGSAATLRWNLKDGQAAYILGVGEIAGRGSIQVRPRQTTAYTLLVMSQTGITSKSVELEVKNAARGDDDTCSPRQSDYKYPKTFTSADTSIISALGSIHRVLQDQMGLVVSEIQTPPLKPHFFFSTNCAIKGNLVFPGDAATFPEDKHIGARRVSYQVEISESSSARNPGQPPELGYRISTFIQYRRKIESTWRIEQNETAYERASEMLRGSLPFLHN
ncbi:hypothetical protein [Terriglobus roseus]|nr:hypothetical protein [Terriglobus roseus]